MIGYTQFLAEEQPRLRAEGRAEEAGMDDFLAKPMDPESMFATILKWLSARNTGGPAQASPTKFSD